MSAVTLSKGLRSRIDVELEQLIEEAKHHDSAVVAARLLESVDRTWRQIASRPEAGWAEQQAAVALLEVAQGMRRSDWPSVEPELLEKVERIVDQMKNKRRNSAHATKLADYF